MEPMITRAFEGNPEDGPESDSIEDRATTALRYAFSYGQVDGEHHKAWVIDQMVRALTGSGYEAAIDRSCDGEDGPETYYWDEGIAP
jgi:hypothetical protein